MKPVASLLVIASLAITALAGTAFAAGSSHRQEAKVKAALTAHGFKKWKRIELDRGVWEVDDAVNASGKQYDLQINAKNMKIISKVAE